MNTERDITYLEVIMAEKAYSGLIWSFHHHLSSKALFMS